jgi:glycosyltransferase involved in cell wall biosynthesis
MNALFICPGLRPGGAERQWNALIPALHDHGVHATVLALNHEGSIADSLRNAKVDVRCAEMRNRLDVLRLSRAVRSLGNEFDVVVTRSVNAHVVGSYVAKRLGVSHVATEHSQYDLLPLRVHQRALMRFAARRATAAVCVTAAQIEPLRSLGYAHPRITVIRNAVPPDAVVATRTRSDVLAELDVPDDAFLAVMIAGLRPEKQPLHFIAAVRQAHALNARIHGVLVGDGTQREVVDAACVASDGAVRAVGTRDDVGNFIHACDVVCLTSRSEASPLALLEAIAVGKPIIATAVGGVPQLVRPGETGVLVTPGDIAAVAAALAQLASDRSTATHINAGAQRQARMLPTFDEMVGRYAQVLKRAGRRDEKDGSPLASHIGPKTEHVGA